MKKLIIILLTLHASLFTLHSPAQGDWYPLFPEPTGNDLSDVCFVDDNNGWTVGKKGTILYTSDGGENWEFQESGTELRLRSVYFTDDLTGWVAGGETHPIPGEYIILRTEDGGSTWIEQDSDSTGCLRDVFFVDNENGWAVGDRDQILNTSDGGMNWTIQQSGIGYYYGWEVFFLDTLKGWIACSNGLQYTTDGGINWDVKIYESFESVFLINETTGWASNYGSGLFGPTRLLYTTDGFKTWDTLISCCGGEYFSGGYYSIYFKDSINGWMLHDSHYSGGWVPGSTYSLLKTQDGGNNWEQIDIPITSGLNASINSLSFSPQGKGCIVGHHGSMTTTTNWEDDWVIRSQGNNYGLNAIQFIDQLNGWAGGSSYYSPYWINGGSIILHTADGGLSWVEQDNPGIGPIQSIHFTDNTIGWAVGNSYPHDTAYIINTTNGGEEWLIWLLYTNYIFEDVTFIDGSSGWVVGWYDNDDDEGRILKTSDGGVSWSEQSCDTCNSLYSVFFVDQDIGWVGGKEIYHTSDGGETWIIQDYDTTGYDIVSIFFIDENKGWAVGNKWASSWNIILKTENGGETWSYELVSYNVSSVHFKDAEHGLISTTDGKILFTQDGGITWEEMDSGSENPLFSVFCTPEGQGYAAGGWGTIVKSDLLTVSVDEPGAGIQNSKFKIQNYPNPTSGIVNFQFTIYNLQSVSIKIYDLHGREVATVIDHHLPAGEHVLSFDASHLPSGVYIYRNSAVGSQQTAVGKLIKY